MVIPLRENYQRNRPKWRFLLVKFIIRQSLHGMGFAGVLVELVIIFAVLLFMFLISKYNLKPRYFLVGGSTTIAVISALWVAEGYPYKLASDNTINSQSKLSLCELLI